MSTAKALSYRRLSAAEAQARRRIGAGLFLEFTLGGDLGQLTLRQVEGNGREGGVALSSEFGLLRLNRASALLSLISSCPALLPEETDNGGSDDHDWYWSLYNQHLSPQLRTLFGHLAPTAQAPGAGLPCELQVRLGEQLVRSEVLLPYDTLERLLARPGWHPLNHSPADDWRFSCPVTVGHCSLSMRKLRSLRRGDVVLPDRPLFQPEGNGCLFLGRQRLQVRLESHPTAHFIVTDLEETAMNAYVSELTASPENTELYVDPSESFSADAPDDMEIDHQAVTEDAFDDLPLALTLNCGRLSLSLGELKALGPGSVLSLGMGTPGFATLCHDNRPLAHGELVDVDGHIGLQITRLELGR